MSASSISSKGKSDEEGGVKAYQQSLSADEAELLRFGYKQEFRREFTNISTISFAFSIMGVASSVATTFGTPFFLGGPASVVWCWFAGSIMCMCLGTSIAELVSAYPTNGGLYSASAYLTPKKYKAIVGWCVGWLNLLGQIAGVASTDYGLAQMIAAAVAVGTDGEFVASTAQIFGIFAAILVSHGLLNSVGTRILALFTQTFVFINLGTVLAVIIALLVTCKEKHPASYVFTSTVNGSGWQSNGLSFLLGLLSVQWTMTDYDATAHISEEVKRASIAAPVAIFVAVIGTGISGWIYNIVYVLCSGPFEDLPGISGYAPATIIVNNVGKTGFYILWSLICFVAYQVGATALQANARTVYAFSRDRGLPDRGLFRKLAPNLIPIYAVWLVVFISALMGVLSFASYTAVEAIFSLCAVALDGSYIIPIALKMIFRDHPEVNFKPGPFDLGRGWMGKVINLVAIFWTCFVVIILSLPEAIPVTAQTMNYAAPIAGMVLLGSLGWYVAGAHKTYKGPAQEVSQEEINKQLYGKEALPPAL